MDNAVEAVLADYQARMDAEHKLMDSLSSEEFGRRVDEFLLPVGRDTAVFMTTLLKSAEAKAVLEIGSSFGYSTIWLADAVRATGGKLTTLELAANKQAHAKEMIARAKLSDYVDFRLGDARALIAELKGPFDFVLLDLWKDLYIPCFDLVYPKLADGAFVIADNMIAPASSVPQATQYRRHIHAKDDMDTVLLPIGSGVEVSRRRTRPV